MNRKAKEVISTFNLKKPLTNAAYVVKRHYLRMLFEFEHVYFFDQPLSSFWERGLIIITILLIIFFNLFYSEINNLFCFVFSQKKMWSALSRTVYRTKVINFQAYNLAPGLKGSSMGSLKRAILWPWRWDHRSSQECFTTLLLPKLLEDARRKQNCLMWILCSLRST